MTNQNSILSKKLIKAASNNSKSYNDEASAMAAHLGYMTSPTISGSVRG
jgi:hypothetical protein